MIRAATPGCQEANTGYSVSEHRVYQPTAGIRARPFSESVHHPIIIKTRL